MTATVPICHFANLHYMQCIAVSSRVITHHI